MDTYHLDTIYVVRDQKCEDLWLFFETKKRPANKILVKTGLDNFIC